MDAGQKADLLARIAKAQSVGATILSNMTQAKKLADLIVPDDAQPDPPPPPPKPATLFGVCPQDGSGTSIAAPVAKYGLTPPVVRLFQGQPEPVAWPTGPEVMGSWNQQTLDTGALARWKAAQPTAGSRLLVTQQHEIERKATTAAQIATWQAQLTDLTARTADHPRVLVGSCVTAYAVWKADHDGNLPGFLDNYCPPTARWLGLDYDGVDTRPGSPPNYPSLTWTQWPGDALLAKVRALRPGVELMVPEFCMPDSPTPTDDPTGTLRAGHMGPWADWFRAQGFTAVCWFDFANTKSFGQREPLRPGVEVDTWRAIMAGSST